ncbi:hypothetical protein KSS93_16760 [Pseudomonas xanthosomatis]|nr:hypothetical protein [Pseudomonas xanthosomatis]QXH44536.1 hypothetical protein KSS93_16760 [Pseudomonas xanthosomatis]
MPAITGNAGAIPRVIAEYWISMACSLLFVGFLLFMSWLCFWAARALRG